MSKKNSQKGKSKPKPCQKLSSAENSFLNETSFISEIDLDIRLEIEKKFKKSSVNSKYVFPRVQSKAFKPTTKKSTSRPNSRSKLQLLKSLPVMHKFTKSTFDVTNLVSNNLNLKKMHRATSSIKILKEKEKKNIHSRHSSHLARSKSPMETNKVKSRESSARDTNRHNRNASSKRGYYDGILIKQKSGLKKSNHLYTASIESVVPGDIIKTVSYY
jgi:hypothetical protein